MSVPKYMLDIHDQRGKVGYQMSVFGSVIDCLKVKPKRQGQARSAPSENPSDIIMDNIHHWSSLERFSLYFETKIEASPVGSIWAEAFNANAPMVVWSLIGALHQV